MKTQNVTLSDETAMLLMKLCEHHERPLGYFVEEALWSLPAFVEYATEAGYERPERTRPGRPPRK